MFSNFGKLNCAAQYEALLVDGSLMLKEISNELCCGCDSLPRIYSNYLAPLGELFDTAVSRSEA